MSSTVEDNHIPANFIPPKKRTTGKKVSGAAQNHVDHIHVPEKHPHENGTVIPQQSESKESITPSKTPDSPGQDLEEASTASLSASDGQLSEKSTDIDLLREAVKKKKHVNIQLLDKIELAKQGEKEGDLETVNETTALRVQPSNPNTPDESLSVNEDGYLTMTGTIKRGKKAGQNIDVKLNISREELEVLEASLQGTKSGDTKSTFWSFQQGFHIFIWTIICLPVVFFISGLYSFYMGTITWYNIFTFYSEEKSIAHKILISPILILSYPFLIILFMIGLGIYSAAVQISWFLDSWIKEVYDLEKGFYGWLCSSLKLEDCSPYTVVVLTDVQQVNGIQKDIPMTADKAV